MSLLKEKYIKEIRIVLMKKLEYKNVMQVPRIEKIVVNAGIGEGGEDQKAIESAMNELASITGQHPVITRAKKSISNFKIRKGLPIGCKVTLRGNNMYEFFDRLVNVALPRIGDFKGIPSAVFDGKGNLTIGIKEQIIFPEVDYDKVYKIRGMDISIITTAKTNQESKELLLLMGMPFAKK
ncbi:50S ribosomal protein L5 [Candidatus Desantisbacteria bacterium CG1_02_38_46]|uniref:Large ribosomal subunit protein uL5 n=3 Tax=unclassified Candidatus Desantisiibacteriota TaxID=3106372 RepID=A0A2H9PCI7_9BACT|nr:ribosomal protein L5 [uncultured bacterium]OIN97482.1 MAG: 50S ribosomal protein L5 [Candidatus Desantisbacteria bacterium CG1_02_38_46]PIU51325.1 MAG: 50S ribosomal protein L5 [Candidatus Desantisbacteria bacterium CG07_land_8_20_14_0_80_39_15]PIZ16949.1 MAG: 50S ribosomal protein L5 [Candidatus Desantisbacteria bacterium CG_4_10_14_0_8_um_filter_39_17]